MHCRYWLPGGTSPRQRKSRYATGQVIQMIPPELGEYDVTPEALLRIMDEHDIEKAVLLQDHFGFQNLYTWELSRNIRIVLPVLPPMIPFPDRQKK